MQVLLMTAVEFGLLRPFMLCLLNGVVPAYASGYLLRSHQSKPKAVIVSTKTKDEKGKTKKYTLSLLKTFLQAFTLAHVFYFFENDVDAGPVC